MKRIGMIVPSVDNSFFASLASEVGEALRAAGYVTILANSANDAEREKAYLREFAGMTDGVLCVSGLAALPQGLIPDDFPLVWLDRVPDSGHRLTPWVANDDAIAMELATRHLISKGCRNILLLPGYLAEHQESPRVSGYRRALEDSGLAFRPEFVLNRRGEKSSEAETEEMVQRVMDSNYALDGIITSSDRAAFGAMTALKAVGYYVPEDIRLISFDNSPYSAMASTPITALDRNTRALAQKACQILMALLRGEKVENRNIIPVSLVERISTT